MLNQRLTLAVESIRVSGLRVDDFSVNIHRVIVLERRIASKHFVKKNSESPPVDGFSVALVQQNLRSDVLRSSANGVCSLCNDLCKAEVNHLQVAISANHDVLRLQIPVDNVETLKILENRDDLGSVESCLFGVEVADTSVVGEEVSALEEFGDEVNEPVVLHEAVVFHLDKVNISVGLTMKGW